MSVISVIVVPLLFDHSRVFYGHCEILPRIHFETRGSRKTVISRHSCPKKSKKAKRKTDYHLKVFNHDNGNKLFTEIKKSNNAKIPS